MLNAAKFVFVESFYVFHCAYFVILDVCNWMYVW